MCIRAVYGFVVAAAIAAIVPLAAQSTLPNDGSSKLTSVLATLAGAVLQDDGRITVQRIAPGPRLAMDALPERVQDAIRGRRLRLNDANEIQVYILMSAVTDERVAQLTAAGVTIEIPDTGRRRVQARVPASRLRLIASLPFVDYIRFPAYARHLSGAVTSEGDKIQHADAVRQQLSLDGDGVRVGVLSDGLKGIFETGCEDCGSLSARMQFPMSFGPTFRIILTS